MSPSSAPITIAAHRLHTCCAALLSFSQQSHTHCTHTALRQGAAAVGANISRASSAVPAVHNKKREHASNTRPKRFYASNASRSLHCRHITLADSKCSPSGLQLMLLRSIHGLFLMIVIHNSIHCVLTLVPLQHLLPSSAAHSTMLHLRSDLQPAGTERTVGARCSQACIVAYCRLRQPCALANARLQIVQTQAAAWALASTALAWSCESHQLHQCLPSSRCLPSSAI